jgi:hypothetical protein
MLGGIFLKSVTDFWPKSTPRIGHLPPSDFRKSVCSIVNVLLFRLVLNSEVNLHPPSMYVCVLVRGDWYLVQVREGPCFRLHLWM